MESDDGMWSGEVGEDDCSYEGVGTKDRGRRDMDVECARDGSRSRARGKLVKNQIPSVNCKMSLN